MNARLKKVKDGTGAMHRSEVVWFDVKNGNDTTRKESGEVYWPFALVFNCTSSSDHNYDVIHLPTGLWFVSNGAGVPRRYAMDLVRKLRAIAEWDFQKPTGPRWEKARTAANELYHAANKKAREAK